ncbi:putative pectinesterase/pectinesterase inhibitor 45 [Ziziphus jujuba]|uniref:Pectinesterase n=1 Tax=Ziziphus jujuba TaxID=326968 RepID=A0A6P6GCZ9_ZIZJJ|nr:putative pectinesterase/pectinesterase inhibitor 45 [Ziziphus jujuba]
MVFQDFDKISERRRAERERKFKKRVTIGLITGLVLLVIIAAGVIVLVTTNNNNNDSNSNNKNSSTTSKSNKGSSSSSAKPSSSSSTSASSSSSSSLLSSSSGDSSSTRDVVKVEKVITSVCSSTDYKQRCHDSLTAAAKKQPELSQPKDFIKVAISAASDELTKAFNKTSNFTFNTPEEKAAFGDCKVLMEDALEELEASGKHVGDNATLTALSSKTPDLNSWLSAVQSYQQTCIDGFPVGKLKTDVKNAFNATKEFTSNSLALISEVVSFLSTLQTPGSPGPATTRHLLDTDGFPTWMSHEDRRMLKASDVKLTPNVTVAKDGSGKFKTINAALAAMPANYTGRFVIYVKEGVYDETVIVTKKMVNVTIYGDGSQKSIITGKKNFVDGVRTFETASFAALGEGFMGKAMGFRNTAGPEKHQAVAARIQSDRAIFVNCRFEGYQDTLYAQTHRQFYRSCVIAGTVDFIFGDAAAIFQNCNLVVRKPLDNQQNIVTAQGRTDVRETTGFVLQNCRVMADKALVPVKEKIRSYLGRPWKEFSRTIFMESDIEDIIHPDGWMPWEGEFALKTLYYAEYNNKGAGSKTTARVKWPGYKVIDKQEANKFTVENFLPGSWLNATGVPVQKSFYF